MTKQYIVENGIRKNNPAWTLPEASFVVPFANKQTALAVVSTPQALEDKEIVVTPMYEAALAQYQAEVEPEIFIPSGSTGTGTSQGGLEELNRVLAKYEVPAGLLSKLLQLKDFDAIEIIVDDSGSMNAPTDARGPRGESLTRWQEARYRISQMMELIAYVVSPPVVVRFLNRTDTLELKRLDNEAPKQYIQRTEMLLNETFGQSPSGLTPALQVIQASLSRYPGQATLRYFLGDGVPNGGDTACRQIEQLLIHRAQPQRNPFTFMSCTGNDADTEWMKECEEKAPYCAEFDDYEDESREILRDQGNAFPYSFGLHLVGQIVAAFNPHDLDAMDESIPFTRQTLDNLLGYQSSPEEYRYYFDSFLTAQRKLSLTFAQREFIAKLPSLYEQFESANIASDIPAAADYKKQQLQADQRSQQQSQMRGQQPPQGECCVIL